MIAEIHIIILFELNDTYFELILIKTMPGKATLLHWHSAPVICSRPESKGVNGCIFAIRTAIWSCTSKESGTYF